MSLVDSIPPYFDSSFCSLRSFDCTSGDNSSPLCGPGSVDVASTLGNVFPVSPSFAGATSLSALGWLSFALSSPVFSAGLGVAVLVDAVEEVGKHLPVLVHLLSQNLQDLVLSQASRLPPWPGQMPAWVSPSGHSAFLYLEPVCPGSTLGLASF